MQFLFRQNKYGYNKNYQNHKSFSFYTVYMDKKLGKVLLTIQRNTSLTKLDIKNKTGFSMTTVLRCVSTLEEQGLITCATRDGKGGKAPSVINVSYCAYVIGIACTNEGVTATRTDLFGNVEEIIELDNIDIQNAINAVSKEYPPSAIGIIANDTFRLNIFPNVPKRYGTILEGLSFFYRFYSHDTGGRTVVLYFDNHITLSIENENARRIILDELYSPLIHRTNGRMRYSDVLSEQAVSNKLSGLGCDNIKELTASNNPNVIAYRQRIIKTINELLSEILCFVSPKSVIIGGFLPENLFPKVIEGSDCSVIYAGTVSGAGGNLASALALSCLYCYDSDYSSVA